MVVCSILLCFNGQPKLTIKIEHHVRFIATLLERKGGKENLFWQWAEGITTAEGTLTPTLSKNELSLPTFVPARKDSILEGKHTNKRKVQDL